MPSPKAPQIVPQHNWPASDRDASIVGLLGLTYLSFAVLATRTAPTMSGFMSTLIAAEQIQMDADSRTGPSLCDF